VSLGEELETLWNYPLVGQLSVPGTNVFPLLLSGYIHTTADGLSVHGCARMLMCLHTLINVSVTLGISPFLDMFKIVKLMRASVFYTHYAYAIARWIR